MAQDDLKIRVDLSAIDRLAKDFEQASGLVIRRIAERGEQHLRAEVPRETNNLAQGITSDVTIQPPTYRAEFTVSARSGRRGARQAVVHYPSGNTKTVKLRPQPAFDYAEAVARGRKAVKPRRAKVLLIPVSNAPSNEAYLTSGGQTFVMRRSAKATKPNEYDKRAVAKLQTEIPIIVETQYEKFGLLKK